MNIQVDESEPLLSPSQCRTKIAQPRGKAKQTLCLFVLEPAAILYACFVFPGFTMNTQFLYQKIGKRYNYDYLGRHTSSCIGNQSSFEFITQQKIQEETSAWLSQINLAFTLPSLVTTILIGSYSDRTGRKILIILPMLGKILEALVFLLDSYFNLSPSFLLFGSILHGLSGSWVAFFVGAFAYMADITKTEDRTWRITLINSLMAASGAGSDILYGFWIRSTHGFQMPLLGLCVGQTVAFLYTVFVVPETVHNKPKPPDIIGNPKITQIEPVINSCEAETAVLPNSSEQQRGDNPHSCEIQNQAQNPNCSNKETHLTFMNGLKKCVMLFIKDDGSKRRWQLIILLFIFFLFVVPESSAADLLNLRQIDDPLCFDPVLLGYYLGIFTITKHTATVLFVGLCSRCLPDPVMVAIGCVFAMAFFIYSALVETKLLMFLGILVGILQSVTSPVLRAMMSKLVNADEQGSMFSVVALVDTVCMLLGKVAMDALYSATVGIYKNTVFFVLVGYNFLALVFTCIYMCKKRTH
ncbi:unnamed protein product [Owenia fusiformis]|uniref:Uncharacterized protein n=1 Tax=Owenia fusiformis TaxID=6347 RepID=A0A8J1TUF6_OWEFU|nr:unnamed protein product [Owenia fusiformis]